MSVKDELGISPRVSKVKLCQDSSLTLKDPSVFTPRHWCLKLDVLNKYSMYKYTNKRSIQIKNYLGQSARIQGLATRGLGKSFLWLGYGLINSFKTSLKMSVRDDLIVALSRASQNNAWSFWTLLAFANTCTCTCTLLNETSVRLKDSIVFKDEARMPRL